MIARSTGLGRVAIAMSAVFLLNACGEDPKPSRRGRRKKKSKPAAAAAAPASAGPSEVGEGKSNEDVYSLDNNFSGRDPFRSYLRDFIVKPGEEGEGMAEIRTHLERFDLGELRPMAIITGTAVPKAMVVDPSGLGHVIQPGTRLGRRGGKVVRISTNSIVVRHIDEELGTAKETRVRLHDGSDGESYRLNIVRHDLEEDERAKAQANESVLEGLDIDTLLKEDKGGGAAPQAPAAKAAAEGGTY